MTKVQFVVCSRQFVAQQLVGGEKGLQQREFTTLCRGGER